MTKNHFSCAIYDIKSRKSSIVTILLKRAILATKIRKALSL